MTVYRIVQERDRANDLSGTGAFKFGGRWNNQGVYMLYTSENRSLALLETLAHFDEEDAPPDLYILSIQIARAAPIYDFPDSDLPHDWRDAEHIVLKGLGGSIFKSQKHVGFRARSAVLTEEFNIMLNPLFPGFADLVKIASITRYQPDARLYSRTFPTRFYTRKLNH
ncbi:MAG TPA: RES family NAD+ phosphorylase [Puia sp.]|nr:RES family NAD+ phosphorylase [Puia sp.]